MIKRLSQFHKSLLQELNFQSSQIKQKCILHKKNEIQRGLNAEKSLQVLEKILNKNYQRASSQNQPRRPIILANKIQQDSKLSCMNVLNSNNQNAKFQSYPEQPSSDLETLLQQKLNQQEQLKMKPEGEDLFLKSVHYQLAGLKSKNQTQISNNESLSFQIGLKLENKEIIKSAYKDESKINSRDQNLSKQQNQGILNQGKLINISQVNQNNLLHFDDQNEFSLFQGQNSNKFEDILATKQSQLKKQKLQVKEITNNLNVRDHSLNKTRVNNLKQQEKKVYK